MQGAGCRAQAGLQRPQAQPPLFAGCTGCRTCPTATSPSCSTPWRRCVHGGGLWDRVPCPAQPRAPRLCPQCSFAPGHVIIREGDEGESFYIILKGQVGAVPRGRAVPPIPLSLAPRPLAGAGEPAGGRAREAAACAGCWRALRGALAAGVGALGLQAARLRPVRVPAQLLVCTWSSHTLLHVRPSPPP